MTPDALSAAPVAAGPSAGAASVADTVRGAVARGVALRVVGAGTWLDAGRPVRAGARAVEPLETTALSGIVDYVPGDLTLTARAGTTLAEIARVTAAHGQWLALDPHGSETGTLGATIATASAGPLAATFGAPRDQVLGVEFVTGAGRVVRAGGRVVKNVAGFDLTRLVTGAWGTLGVITEASVRLRARPEVDQTIAFRVGHGRDDVPALCGAVRALPFAPYAAELLAAPLAAVLGLGEDVVLLVRLGGSAEAVAAQRHALASIAALRDPSEAPDDVWTRLRAADTDGSAVVRLSWLPARFHECWTAAERLVWRAPGTLLHGSLRAGIVRAIVPMAGREVVPLVSAFQEALRPPFEGAHVYERLPDAAWSTLAPSAVADRLSRGVRQAFDPDRVLNPGILGSD